MRVAIVGSRHWKDREAVRALVATLAPDDVVVSGACPNSPDQWAAEAARARGLKVIEFPAEWTRLGKRAGYARNVTIVRFADAMHAFRALGISNGTDHVVSLAKKKGIPVTVWTEEMKSSGRNA